MASINSRETVDIIIAGNGIYPGDDDMPVVKIVKYTNAWNGETFGLIYAGEDLDRYHASEFVIRPETIWERKN